MARYTTAAFVAALLAGAALPSQLTAAARPEPAPQLPARDDEDVSPPEWLIDAVRWVNVHVSTMAIGRVKPKPNNGPPPVVDTPIVVRPPLQIQSQSAPKDTVLPPDSKTTPEPGSVLTAVVGGALALMGWRRRRRLKAIAAAAEAESA